MNKSPSQLQFQTSDHKVVLRNAKHDGIDISIGLLRDSVVTRLYICRLALLPPIMSQ